MSDTPGDEEGAGPPAHRVPSLANSLHALLIKYRSQWPDDLRECVENYIAGLDRGGAYIRSSSLPPLWKALDGLLRDDPDRFRDEYTEATRRFIAGAKRAHAANEDLVAS